MLTFVISFLYFKYWKNVTVNSDSTKTNCKDILQSACSLFQFMIVSLKKLLEIEYQTLWLSTFESEKFTFMIMEFAIQLPN